MFSGAYGGVHVTSDNGSTWSTPSSLHGRAIYALSIRNGLMFAGSSGNGPYASTDGGTTGPPQTEG